ncbi:receptor-type tyrosine-protein phosphatase N2-like [Anneissia japonica]|uniref:receptor-type tyrosine-protein phosphatase N2-like n=1 Tax=Anneissia japonica TaxID=1529436 RepID=UPI0014256FC2|nr:receptor-type tyrosine-protein phosphatase N2-like [Anneissia japonica]
MEDHMRNKDRLTEEWKALSEYEAEPNFTTIGKMAKNLSKNRFEDVLPYDHTRVILKETTGPSQSDYINASLITDSDPRSPAYISTQAPLPNTMSDFWQMIWENGVVVIVNLTRPAENDIVQCEKYWPEEDNKAYENYEVHLVSEHVWCEDYLVRSFYLKNLLTNETRTVTQFHYLTWPDNGVPASPRSLLEFRRKVNKSYRGRCCPILVHCSDGIGRTGTYCLIDMTLTRMIKGAKEIDLAATLEHVRDQRPGMVRTMEQFEFVLTAVAEEVNAILKAIPQ